MRVTVRLFARLREIAGAETLVREVPPGATAGSLWDDLAREFPELVAYGDAVSTAINEEYARRNAAIAEGDEIAFLPPVSGG